MKNRKLLISKLLRGAYLVKVHGKLTLYEGNRIPVLRIPDNLIRSINKWNILKPKGTDKQVISIRAVQRLHGKNSIKRLYKQFLNEKSHHFDGEPQTGAPTSKPGRPQKTCARCVIKSLLQGAEERAGADIDGPGADHQLYLFL
jgi:hypothetical protein